MKHLLISNPDPDLDIDFNVIKEGEATFVNIGPEGATIASGDRTDFYLKRHSSVQGEAESSFVINLSGTFAVVVDGETIPHSFTREQLPIYFREGNIHKIKIELDDYLDLARYKVTNLDYDNEHEIRFVRLTVETELLPVSGGGNLDELGTEVGAKLSTNTTVACFGSLSYTGYHAISGTWDLEVNEEPIVTNADIIELRTELSNLGIEVYVVTPSLTSVASSEFLVGNELIKLQNRTETGKRIRLIYNTNAVFGLPLVETIGAVTEYTDRFIGICLAPTIPAYADDGKFYTTQIDITAEAFYYIQTTQFQPPELVAGGDVITWLLSKGFKYSDNQLIVNVSDEQRWLRIESTAGKALSYQYDNYDAALNYVDHSKTSMEGLIDQTRLDVPSNFSWDFADNILLNLTTYLDERRYLLFIDDLPANDTLSFLSMSEIINILATRNIKLEVLDNNRLVFGLLNQVASPAIKIAIKAPGYTLEGVFDITNSNGLLIPNTRDALLFSFHESMYMEDRSTFIQEIPFIIDESILGNSESYLLGHSASGMFTIFKIDVTTTATLNELYDKLVLEIDPTFFTIGTADFTETGKLKFNLTTINIEMMGLLSFQFIGPKDSPVKQNVITTVPSAATVINSNYGFLVNAVHEL